MSKGAFDTFHLYKFMSMFYNNADFMKIISQRKNGELQEWASLSHPDKRPASDETLAYIVKKKIQH